MAGLLKEDGGGLHRHLFSAENRCFRVLTSEGVFMRALILLVMLGGAGMTFYANRWEDVLCVMFFLGFALVALLGLFYRHSTEGYEVVESDD